MEPQKAQKFEQTAEAQEYLQKLTQGRIKLTQDASFLEAKAHQNFVGLQKQANQLQTQRDNAQKQIERLQEQVKNADRDLDGLSGQMAAYAQLLIAAEGERRGYEAFVATDALPDPGPLPPPTEIGPDGKERPCAPPDAPHEEAKGETKGNGKVTNIKAKAKGKGAEANA